MNVRAAEGRGCFWVESRSERNHEHYVDLVANRGQGECACDNWKYRCSPALAKGFKGPKVWCSHIKAARDSLGDLLPDRISVTQRETSINRIIAQWMEEEKPLRGETGPTWPPLFGNGSDSED